MRCTRPGTYALHMAIDGLSMLGSPVSTVFHSTRPDLSLSEISGSGTSSFKTNEPARIWLTLRDAFANRCHPPPAFLDEHSFGMSMMVVTAQMLAAQKGLRMPVCEQPLFPDMVGKWGVHSAKDGGGCYYELSYTRREGGAGISLQLWYSRAADGHRVALHEKPFMVGEGVAANQQHATVASKTSAEAVAPQAPHAKQTMPGDYSVSKRVFDEAQARWGKCEIDVFASEATALCRRFLIPGNADDPYADLGSAESANGLKMIWVREERLWAHPPKELLPKLLDILELPNCTAEVLVCCPDEHEVLGTIKSLQHVPPAWYLRLLAISDDHVAYPPGELRGVAEDAPAKVGRWPICVFRVPPKRRFLERRNARVKLEGEDTDLIKAEAHVMTHKLLAVADWTGTYSRERRGQDGGPAKQQ